MTDDVYPRVKLIYYPGPEGGKRKEIRYFDLTEWTLEKDVYLDYGWTEPKSKNNQRQVLEGEEPPARDYSLPKPRQRTWRIRYEAAGTEGQSRLFIGGIGGRHGRLRIYGDNDLVALIYIGTSGWHELGAEARLYRYLQDRHLNNTSASSFPTRSQ